MSRTCIIAAAAVAVLTPVSGAANETPGEAEAQTNGDAAVVANASASASSDWTLVWSDEFDGAEINPDNWSADVDCWGRRQ